MSVLYWNQKYLKNICSFRHPFCHHCTSLNSCLASRTSYKSVSQPYFSLSRCICLSDFVCWPHGSKGCMLMASPYKHTYWWPGPLHACHFSSVYIAQLSGSSLEWLRGQGLGDSQESEWQLCSNRRPCHRLMYFRGRVPAAGIFHHICGLRRTYLLKAIGFADLHRSLESSLFYSGRKWHLQKRRGTFAW